MKSLFFRASLCSALIAAFAIACSKKEKVGTLGGDCFPNWTCNAGLVCDRGMCVPDGSSTGNDSSSEGSSEQLAEALDACFDCGKDACATEADACKGEAGCDEALSCSLRCAGDVNCGSSCDVSGLTSSGVTAMTNYTVCTTQKCKDTCVDAFIDLAGSTSGDGDGDGDGDAPDKLEAAIEVCLDCGADECATSASACAAASGCKAALSCFLECAGDQSCADACDVSTLAQDGLSAMADYLACTVDQCKSACVDDISDIVGSTTSTTGDTDDTGDTGEPCTSGEERSSCVESAPQVCINGSWVEESCEGCALVSPSDSCAKISAIAFRKSSEEEVTAFSPASMTLTQTASSVTGAWDFDYSGYEQYGVIQFKFASPFDPSTVTIDATGQGLISFETDDGSSGCEYVLSGGMPIQNSDEYWDGCWGTTSSSRTVINVRSPSRTIEGAVTLTVTGISL